MKPGRKRIEPRRILIAGAGVATMNYLSACSDLLVSSSGNLVAPVFDSGADEPEPSTNEPEAMPAEPEPDVPAAMVGGNEPAESDAGTMDAGAADAGLFDAGTRE